MVVLFYPCTFIAIKQLQSNSYLYSPLGLLIETIIKGIELQKKVKKVLYLFAVSIGGEVSGAPAGFWTKTPVTSVCSDLPHREKTFFSSTSKKYHRASTFLLV